VHTKAEVGRLGEQAALDRYIQLGYELIARNWACRLGELDLIVGKHGLIVFCEVKTRQGLGFGAGYEAVTARKRGKLRALAEAFLLSTGAPADAMRFDVASVDVQPGSGGSAVELFQDAF
jgi:putative endonuclease